MLRWGIGGSLSLPIEMAVLKSSCFVWLVLAFLVLGFL